MKRTFTQSLKATAAAVCLLGTATVAQAAVITPGQSVSEFIVNEEFGIVSAPAFTTADSLANWAFGSYGEGNCWGNRDQRGWRAAFEVNAPAAGKYGVEVKLRTTTTNWMIGFGATDAIDYVSRMDSAYIPTWENLVRPTLISTLKSDTVVVSEAVGEIGSEDYKPEVIQIKYSFDQGEWETIYVPVELKEGHNYVNFWLCRTYQGDDALKGPDGTVNGMYIQSIKLMPQGSGAVASVLQKATLKLWQQRMYPAMDCEGGRNLSADYTSLLNAYATATDYSSLDTMKIHAGVEAVAAREQDLRHGQGAIIDGDSAIFALPYYHNLLGGAISENERGEYPDAPMVFEYTNGKTLIYKFTTTIDGTFYPEFYFGTASSTKAHINIYAADSTTKMCDTWSFDPNTGAWQTYQMFSNPSLNKFEAKAGETYYLTMKFDNYVNVRGLYMRQVVKASKSYAELQEMQAKGEDIFAKYQEGTDGFYAIGGDIALIAPLEEALAVASDLAEDSSSEELTEAYYALEDVIGKVESLPIINVISNSETNIFDIANGTFDTWRMEAGGNIGYVYDYGSVVYDLYSKKDCAYNLEFTCSSPASDMSQIGVAIEVITESNDTLRLFEKVVDVNPAGGWANWTEPNANHLVEGIPVPEGKVKFIVYGVAAASNGFIGNINKFHFTEVPGTEGAGSKAVADDIDFVEVNNNTETKIYTIEGIYVGNNTSLLREGLYIVNGKKVIIK